MYHFTTSNNNGKSSGIIKRTPSDSNVRNSPNNTPNTPYHGDKYTNFCSLFDRARSIHEQSKTENI